MDCSGLVWQAYAQTLQQEHGISFPKGFRPTVKTLVQASRFKSRMAAKIGDVGYLTKNGRYSHVVTIKGQPFVDDK